MDPSTGELQSLDPKNHECELPSGGQQGPPSGGQQPSVGQQGPPSGGKQGPPSGGQQGPTGLREAALYPHLPQGESSSHKYHLL